MRSSAVIVTRVIAESSHTVSTRPTVSHHTCFWLSTCRTVSSTSLKAASDAFCSTSGATSSFHTSWRSKNPSSERRKRRNGISASISRNAIAPAKFARPFRRKLLTTSLVSA